MDAELAKQLLYYSLAVNGFLGTWFLAGIKHYLKKVMSDVKEVKGEVKEIKRDNETNNYRITRLEADYAELPCFQRKGKDDQCVAPSI